MWRHTIRNVIAPIFVSVCADVCILGDLWIYQIRPDIPYWENHIGISIKGEPTGLKYGGNIMNIFMASPATIDRKWYVVDAAGMTLGRLASEVASILRGKNKPIFTPHMDTGDYVIVINAEKIAVTGRKLDQKIYYRHSDYVGGMKQETLKEKLKKKPESVIEHAVKGMLPKGPLGRQMYRKLYVYAGPEHKHAAQKPEVLTF